MEKVTFTRKELYDLVWSTPVTSIIKKYQLKTHEFAKICKKMNVPLPNAGHWQKLRANKSVMIKELQEDDYTVNFIELIERSNDDDKEARNRLQHKNKAKPDLSLVVPDRLIDPDKLVKITAEKLKERGDYLHNGLRISARDTLDIKVSPKNVGRALRFMDFFIKTMRKRGHEFQIQWKETCIIIAEVKIKISIREKLKKIESEESWRNLKPTGILCFKADRSSYKREWYDGKVPLEKHFSKIVTEIEQKVYEFRARMLESWALNAVRKEQEQIKAKHRELVEKEITGMKELFREAKRWKKAALVREYLEKVKKNMGAQGEDRAKWLDWATSKLNWYDPFIEADDELLKNVDRETLKIYEED